MLERSDMSEDFRVLKEVRKQEKREVRAAFDRAFPMLKTWLLAKRIVIHWGNADHLSLFLPNGKQIGYWPTTQTAYMPDWRRSRRRIDVAGLKQIVEREVTP